MGVSKVGLLVVAALSIALLFCIVKNIHADLIITVLGTVIPAYESMKAADSGKREDLVHWLSYWCCFSLISLSEVNKKAILHVLPYYYLFKFILVFYLSSPNFKVSGIMDVRGEMGMDLKTFHTNPLLPLSPTL